VYLPGDTQPPVNPGDGGEAARSMYYKYYNQ
jgi:hypothetical protein